MSDIVSDYHAGIGLVIDAYLDLKKLNPKHELLSLISVDNTGFTIEKEEEFNKRYFTVPEREYDHFPQHLRKMVREDGVHGRYEKNLEDAVKKELADRLLDNKPLEIGDRARTYMPF